MPEAPVPQGGPASPAEGGGVAEAIVKTDETLAKLAQASLQNPQIPDEAKAAIQASLEAFRSFSTLLTQGGGQGPQQGTVSPEQGASDAQPVGMGRPR